MRAAHGVLLVCAVAATVYGTPTAVAQTDFAKTYGSAWSPPLGAWLPDPDTGFDAWAKARTAQINQYDYFVCDGSHTPALPRQNFDYPGSSCPLAKNGTTYVFGAAEPMKGNIAYDSARHIVLYSRGCCAWRGFALTANVAPPPKTVKNADLSAVHTMRGLALGMTMAQVRAIYGQARPYFARYPAGAIAISYTTMRGTPTKAEGDACGQFQSFAFRQGRLISIELLTGC